MIVCKYRTKKDNSHTLSVRIVDICSVFTHCALLSVCNQYHVLDSLHTILRAFGPMTSIPCVISMVLSTIYTRFLEIRSLSHGSVCNPMSLPTDLHTIPGHLEPESRVDSCALRSDYSVLFLTGDRCLQIFSTDVYHPLADLHGCKGNVRRDDTVRCRQQRIIGLWWFGAHDVCAVTDQLA